MDKQVTRFSFFRWGGGPTSYHWTFGWWTGPDEDLHCVIPCASTDSIAEMALSPVCSNRFLAVLAFLAKRFLLAVDLTLLDASLEAMVEWHQQMR